jgi:hypothetical protein
MDDLLAHVLEAHGGLEAWVGVTRLTAQVSAGGVFWKLRGWPNIYADATVELDARREHITFRPFTAPDRISVLDVDPERLTIQTTDGQIVEERDNPRVSYPVNFDPERTRWDAIQVAYFMSAATWNYLTTPFVFTYPGVHAREIEPWSEHGQNWRRLAVTFPKTNANHNADQVFYFDDDLMQRRVDYAPGVAGGKNLVAHYTHGPKTFGDFVFPTRRRVHRREPDGVADQSFAFITLTSKPSMWSGRDIRHRKAGQRIPIADPRRPTVDDQRV